MDARNNPAEQFMNEDHLTVQNDTSISKAKQKMEDNNLRALPVVDSKNRLTGAIGYRDLIRHIQFNPQHTGLEKVMHQPPSFDKEDSLVDLAQLRINSGRKLLVYTQNDKVEGVIGDNEFREAFRKVEDLQKVTTLDLGSSEILRVFEEDTVEEARHKMLDNNISRLPVLDENGNLTGMLTSTDLLKLIVPRQGQASGGTSGKSLKDTKIAGGNEKDSIADIEVIEVMDRQPFTNEGHLDADEAIEKMSDKDHKEIIITESGYPETIFTVKDAIDYVADMKQRNMVLVNLTGLEVAEEKAAVHDQIEKQLRGSLGRKLEQPEEINLRIKKAEKDGKKHRYEATMKLFSEYGQTTVENEAWDLLEVVDTCLADIDRAIRDKKEKKQEH